MKNIDCTVLGDAMIDILLPLSGIEDLHSLSQGGVTNTKMRLSPGGSANVAFYIAKLGGNSLFVGKVGNDYFGKIFLDDLKKNGILANVSISKGENTGIVFVLVFPTGERFFIDDRGANSNLGYEDFNLNLIRDSKYLYFSGYSFQDQEALDSVKRLLKEIADDITIVFNPGAPNLAQQLKDSFISIIHQYVSVLILNEAEAEYLTESSSERQMVDSLLSLTDTVALTKGDKGSIISTQNEIIDVKAIPVKVVDTTGAGDAYAGGFIYGLCQGWNLKDAGELASRVAARVVSHLGARVDLLNLTSQ